jgi:hypothetical protein
MRCIARAYGDEPIDRAVNGAERGLIYLVHPSMEHAVESEPELGVGFPPDFVFVYDEALYTRLKSAFERADSAELRSLWRTAIPLNLKTTW